MKIRFMKRLERLAGETRIFREKYERLYGKKDWSEEIEALRMKTKKQYKVLLWSFTAGVILWAAVLTASGVFFGDVGQLTELKRPEKGRPPVTIPATVLAQTESGEIRKNFTLVVNSQDNPETKETEQQEPSSKREHDTEREIARLIKTINKSAGTGSLILPQKLPDGTNLLWEEKRETEIPILLGAPVAACIYVYTKRYDTLKKREEKARNSILTELPEFINKLVLLLGAGLVVTAAFSKIMEDLKRTDLKKDTYFYQQLSILYTAMETSNMPLIPGLRDFAVRSRVREFMRLSNIISDNMDKGAELVTKLQSESELLWFARKKMAEERGRIAETKLTLPLVILLLALVMITTAPAMMEM